jgi:hypothetical protein
MALDGSPFDEDSDKDLEDSSAHPSELIDEFLASSLSQSPITDAVHHTDMADDLDLDLDLDLEEVAFDAVSSRDRGPGKRVVKPRRHYEMDGNDGKVGVANIRARPAGSSKAGKM